MDPGTDHELVAVVGAKGGCGTTLLAVSLAALHAADRAVCAVDLDFGKGDLAGCIDLWPSRTLHEVMLDIGRLDADVLKGTSILHKGGFSVLAQPHDLGRVLLPTAAEIRPLLTVARDVWSLLVADCGSRADEVALTTMLGATRILLVTTPQVSALRDAGRKLDLLQKLEVPRSRLHLVVNMRGRGGVPRPAIEEQLGIPVAVELPFDPETAGAVDFSGRLLRDQHPGAHLTRAVATLGDLEHGDAPPPPAHPWWRPW